MSLYSGGPEPGDDPTRLYASVAQFRAKPYMVQIKADQLSDDAISDVLSRATAIIESELEFAYAPWAESASEYTVYGKGGQWLTIPAYKAGSLTTVTGPSNITVPDYIQRDGSLLITDSSGRLHNPLFNNNFWIYGSTDWDWPGSGWRVGVPYTINAIWGYGPPPADITEACLEIAARIWQGAKAGFSDVVGVEGGGGVGYNGMYPKLTKHTLKLAKERGQRELIS